MSAPMVKIALSVELSGDWVTPALIADLATELADTAARKMAEAVGHPVEPGPITLGIKAEGTAPRLDAATRAEAAEAVRMAREARGEP